MKKVLLLSMLVFCVAAKGASLYWDVNQTDPNSQVGSGTWDTATANWWNPATMTNVTWPASYQSDANAVFEKGDGSAYTVTLGEDIYLLKAAFEQDVNCTVAGPNTLIIYNPGVRVFENTNVTIDCNIARHVDPNVADVSILVSGQGTILTINGDIFMREIPGVSNTEDFSFGRTGGGGGEAYINLNGTVYNNTVDGVVSGRGWNDGDYEPNRVTINLNGAIEVNSQQISGKGVRLNTGATMVVKGRLASDYICFKPNTNVPDYNVYYPVLRGHPDKTGVWAIKTANYKSEQRYVVSNQNQGGRIYASDLNLEIDVTGMDFNNPNTNTYKLVDHTGAKGGRWYGSLNSISVVEPAGMVGTIVTLSDNAYPDYPEEDPWANDDIYFYIETTDFNQDGCVDFGDFAFFAAAYSLSCDINNDFCNGRDLNHSGIVDINDVAIFVGTWLNGCGN